MVHHFKRQRKCLQDKGFSAFAGLQNKIKLSISLYVGQIWLFAGIWTKNKTLCGFMICHDDVCIMLSDLISALLSKALTCGRGANAKGHPSIIFDISNKENPVVIDGG